MQLQATLVCPACGAAHAETMSTDSCRFFYTCPSCDAHLHPLEGDCCVFCSYSDQLCPPKQVTPGERGTSARSE